MTAEVTVAVVSWNTRELLRRCLVSLEPEHRSGRLDVWVVDNGSSDGSPAMVREEFGWVSLLEPGENLGFGRAVNEVARRAQAPWIAPANADIELTDAALDALLAAARAKDVGIVAPRLILSDGATQHSVHAFPTVRLALLFALGAYRLPGVGDRLCVEGYWNPDRSRAIDWAHGAFLLVRRDAFDAVGGFDERQWMYAEDIDLHWRLRAAGYTAWYEASARIRHAVSAAAEQAFGPRRLQRHLDATYEWLTRRRGPLATKAIAILNSAGSGVRWAALGLAAIVAPRRFAAPRDRSRAYFRAHLRGLRRSRDLAGSVAPPAGSARSTEYAHDRD